MDIKVEIPQLPALMAAAEDAGANAPLLMAGAVKNSAMLVQSLARTAAPHVTGNLQRSILTEVEGPRGRVFVNAPYGLFVEEGTKAHVIEAKNKKVLANRRANIIFGKIVHHPGTTANPFFGRAWLTAQPSIVEQFNKVATILRDAIGGAA